MMWQNLRPIPIYVLQANWDKAENMTGFKANHPMLDWNNATRIKKWQNPGECKFKCEGMRLMRSSVSEGMMHKTEGFESHGIVRCIDWRSGFIIEGTFSKGKAHGLVRLIKSQSVEIQLYTMGHEQAKYKFNEE